MFFLLHQNKLKPSVPAGSVYRKHCNLWGRDVTLGNSGLMCERYRNNVVWQKDRAWELNTKSCSSVWYLHRSPWANLPSRCKPQQCIVGNLHRASVSSTPRNVVAELAHSLRDIKPGVVSLLIVCFQTFFIFLHAHTHTSSFFTLREMPVRTPRWG